MKVVVFGATGNVGTSVVARLMKAPAVTEIVAVARRLPEDRAWDRPRLDMSSDPTTPATAPSLRRVAADIGVDDLGPIVDGADVVVHLAWMIQPERDHALLARTNVEGSRRVIEAVRQHRVPALVFASSVGTYARGPKQRRVDETWPATGIATSTYSRHKAAVEAMLDTLEREDPSIRVVRLRKGLVFKAAAASEIADLFLGRLVPLGLLGRRRIPLVPSFDRLVFQVVHSDDAASAYEAAVTGDERGAFNIAADPPIDARLLAEVMHARSLPVPSFVVRAVASATYAARLQPTSPGWVDLAVGVPTMDTTRARDRLGWSPRHDAVNTSVPGTGCNTSVPGTGCNTSVPGTGCNAPVTDTVRCSSRRNQQGTTMSAAAIFEGRDYEPSSWSWVADQVAEYEASGGTSANTLRDTGIPVIIVTSVGASSGKLRKFALMRVEHDGAYALIASKGGDRTHPAWYANLVAEPTVLIQDGADATPFVLQELSGAERGEWYARGAAVYPPYLEYAESAAQHGRVIPVFLATPAVS